MQTGPIGPGWTALRAAISGRAIFCMSSTERWPFQLRIASPGADRLPKTSSRTRSWARGATPVGMPARAARSVPGSCRSSITARSTRSDDDARRSSSLIRRRSSRTRCPSRTPGAMSYRAPHAPPRPAAWGDVELRLDREAVQVALTRISDVQREAIELAYFGGLTQTEIAERTGVPLGTVKGRLRLGLQGMRAALLPLDGGRGGGGG